MGGAARAGRGDHAALLPRAQPRRPADADARHRRPEHRPLLALRRPDRSSDGAGHRPVPAGGMMSTIFRANPNLWTPLTPPPLWALHFLICYVVQAVYYAKAATPLAGRRPGHKVYAAAT